MSQRGGERKRWWTSPRLPLFIALLWLAFVGVSASVDPAGNARIGTCVFRAATGYPCASCGGTRAARALVRGEVIAAIGQNPMLATLMLASPLLVLLLFHRDPWIWRTTQRVHAVTIAVVICIALNWVYVLTVGPDAP